MKNDYTVMLDEEKLLENVSMKKLDDINKIKSYLKERFKTSYCTPIYKPRHDTFNEMTWFEDYTLYLKFDRGKEYMWLYFDYELEGDK